MKLFIQILFILLFSTKLFAQGENNNWHFGNGNYINFNVNPATYSVSSNLSGLQKSATVSDANGNLLFYSNGCTIWDRNGNVTPNGTNLGNPNLIQNNCGAYNSWYSNHGSKIHIVPNPSDSNQYYLIDLRVENSYTNYSIYYSLVDMRLNNGLGDVVANKKNLTLIVPDLIVAYSSEITFGNCNNYWLIIRGLQNVNNSAHPNLVSIKIDENGISFNQNQLL